MRKKVRRKSCTEALCKWTAARLHGAGNSGWIILASRTLRTEQHFGNALKPKRRWKWRRLVKRRLPGMIHIDYILFLPWLKSILACERNKLACIEVLNLKPLWKPDEIFLLNDECSFTQFKLFKSEVFCNPYGLPHVLPSGLHRQQRRTPFSVIMLG